MQHNGMIVDGYEVGTMSAGEVITGTLVGHGPDVTLRVTPPPGETTHREVQVETILLEGASGERVALVASASMWHVIEAASEHAVVLGDDGRYHLVDSSLGRLTLVKRETTTLGGRRSVSYDAWFEPSFQGRGRTTTAREVASADAE